MLVLLEISAWLFPRIPAGRWVLGLVCLLVVGFMTYGPHVLMVGTVPMDFGTRKAASSATRFIDCMGYVGASGFIPANCSDAVQKVDELAK